jgi:hypothetical protein
MAARAHPPPLTRILRAHMDQFGTGRDGRIFSGIHGGELASITYRRAWGRARCTALPSAEYVSPWARRVYDRRHSCVSIWLHGGVPPAQVAEWAGHSVAVLLRVYAKRIDSQDKIAKRRIEGNPTRHRQLVLSFALCVLAAADRGWGRT